MLMRHRRLPTAHGPLDVAGAQAPLARANQAAAGPPLD